MLGSASYQTASSSEFRIPPDPFFQTGDDAHFKADGDPLFNAAGDAFKAEPDPLFNAGGDSLSNAGGDPLSNAGGDLPTSFGGSDLSGPFSGRDVLTQASVGFAAAPVPADYPAPASYLGPASTPAPPEVAHWDPGESTEVFPTVPSFNVEPDEANTGDANPDDTPT
jgi:hypothetical protein